MHEFGWFSRILAALVG